MSHESKTNLKKIIILQISVVDEFWMKSSVGCESGYSGSLESCCPLDAQVRILSQPSILFLPHKLMASYQPEEIMLRRVFLSTMTWSHRRPGTSLYGDNQERLFPLTKFNSC